MQDIVSEMEDKEINKKVIVSIEPAEAMLQDEDEMQNVDEVVNEVVESSKKVKEVVSLDSI